MPDVKHYTAERIFTGEEWLNNHSILVENGVIKEVLQHSDEPVTHSYDTIIPAFIDLQIYGAYGKLFSVFPEPGTLSLIHKYCIHGGAYWFLPTIATNTNDVLFKCIDAVRTYQKNGGQGCFGLHVEGPWMNKEKRGAHIESLVHSPTAEEAEEIMEYSKGVIKMITLAPEVCSDEVLQMIQDYGVVISAGHSNMTYNEANAAFDKGITAVTHLYNAMSGMMHREVGLVGATLLKKNVYASIIADGYHVDFAAIKIAHELMKERLFLITDAVTETKEGHYKHYRMGDKYIAGGILSGSALTMMQAVQNMIDAVGVDFTEAIKMACTYPAKAAKMENKIAKIAKGFPAHFVATDEALRFVEMVE